MKHFLETGNALFWFSMICLISGFYLFVKE
jgi:hypothetical protein